MGQRGSDQTQGPESHQTPKRVVRRSRTNQRRIQKESQQVKVDLGLLNGWVLWKVIVKALIL